MPLFAPLWWATLEPLTNIVLWGMFIRCPRSTQIGVPAPTIHFRLRNLWRPSFAALPHSLPAWTSYTTCGGTASEPHTALAPANGRGNLYEYLGLEGAARTTKVSASSSQFLDELQRHAGDGSSSAIFWSSQGLNALGQSGSMVPVTCH
jgi:hypothetical protein